MGSVQSFGGKCPVCGHGALFDDYYYKTGEEYQFCRCCGYTKKYYMKRAAKPEWILEEKGGCGVLCLEDGGCTYIYSLLEGCTIESILATMEGIKSQIKAIVTFLPRGKNPEFYNTTPEEWFRQSKP